MAVVNDDVGDRTGFAQTDRTSAIVWVMGYQWLAENCKRPLQSRSFGLPFSLVRKMLSSFNEPVADAPNGDNAAGMFRVRLNLLPQPMDMDINGVGVNELFTAPSQLQKLLPR